MNSKTLFAARMLVLTLIALIIVTSVALARVPTITNVIVDKQQQQRYDTDYNIHVSYDPDTDARLTAWIPELDIIDMTGTNDAGHGIVTVYVPNDTPAGDYLVRIVVSTDDGRDVAYRHITVQ